MPDNYPAIFNQDRHKQHGAALLIMLVILVLGVTVLLVNSLSSSRVKTARQETTAAALAQAKDALIGFAVTYADTHSTPLSPQVDGYLPCPDTDGTSGLQPEGSEETSGGSPCSSPVANINVSVIGRLPWKTLGLPMLRDGDGECLWYAVSGTYKDNPKTDLMMNWDTDGQFQAFAADGAGANGVVAVIFAPGAAQTGQNRSGTTAPVCGGNYTATNYLDAATVNGINFNNADIATGKFIQGTSGGNINDQLVFITRQDIWNAIQKRTDFQPANPNNPLRKLTKAVALCIANYGHYNQMWGIGGGWSSGFSNLSLPWPAPVSLGSNQLSDYAIISNYDDAANLYAGRVPYLVDTSSSASHNYTYITLMTPGSCPTLTTTWNATIDIWWTNWKDQLFYALGNEYMPDFTHYQACSAWNCLTVGSSQYAALVFFAGPRLSNQTRTNKGDITQYLEGINATHFAAPNPPTNGNETYTATTSSTFNDVLCYIKENLGVVCP